MLKHFRCKHRELWSELEGGKIEASKKSMKTPKISDSLPTFKRYKGPYF